MLKMDKTVKQIQNEAETAKRAIKSILDDFMNNNPSICLSGEFGVVKTFVNTCTGRPQLMEINIDLKLNITIDEK